MDFKTTCEYLEKIEKTASRIEMAEILVEAFGNLEEEEISVFCYLVIGRIAPMFVSAEFDMSERSILSALEGFCSFNKLEIDVQSLRSESGDLGLVAEKVLEQKNNHRLRNQLLSIYQQLWDLIHVEGSGAVKKRADLYISMLENLSPVEGKFVTRIIIGKLRMGVSDRTILDALSMSLKQDKSMVEEISDYYGVLPDIGLVSYRYLTGKASAGESPVPVIGIPVKSRLVARIPEFEELFERYEGYFYLQPKFDGLRCQAHKGVDQYAVTLKDAVWVDYLSQEQSEALSLFEQSSVKKAEAEVKLFSRNLEDLTDMFPEIVKKLSSLPTESFILDCEIVGWDVDGSRFNTFQETMKRKRKYKVEETADSVPVRLYIFDVMLFEGKSTINEHFEDRIGILRSLNVAPNDPFLKITETEKVSEMKDVETFFHESVEKGLEGVIAKDADGIYEPGKRTYGWIKLKKSMSKKLVDTVDVVVMGYYMGSGRQSSLGIGALLVGVVGEDGSIESVSKIGTGVTDDQWAKILHAIEPLQVKVIPGIYKVNKALTPDVWIKPQILATVEADEITKSQVHSAGATALGYGLALRFPRLVEFGRDKPFEEATSAKELAKMAGV